MKVVGKKILCHLDDVRITLLEIENQLIADKALPGQFIIIMVRKEGERIPLTVVDTDKNKNTITIVFQEVGLTTKLLGKLTVGDYLYAVVGPLGHPTHIKKYGSIIMVAGGVGVAEILPVTKAFKKEGNRVTTIIGARTKKLLIFEKELRDYSDQMFVATDDGSYGEKGFNTYILKNLLSESSSYDLVYTVGPIPMMKKVAQITGVFGIETIASLNALMVDGSGMCGSCRVSVAGEVKFSCVDGPEFDAHLIDWEELEKRNKVYINKEDISRRIVCE